MLMYSWSFLNITYLGI